MPTQQKPTPSSASPSSSSSSSFNLVTTNPSTARRTSAVPMRCQSGANPSSAFIPFNNLNTSHSSSYGQHPGHHHFQTTNNNQLQFPPHQFHAALRRPQPPQPPVQLQQYQPLQSTQPPHQQYHSSSQQAPHHPAPPPPPPANQLPSLDDVQSIVKSAEGSPAAAVANNNNSSGVSNPRGSEDNSVIRNLARYLREDSRGEGPSSWNNSNQAQKQDQQPSKFPAQSTAGPISSKKRNSSAMKTASRSANHPAYTDQSNLIFQFPSNTAGNLSEGMEEFRTGLVVSDGRSYPSPPTETVGIRSTTGFQSSCSYQSPPPCGAAPMEKSAWSQQQPQQQHSKSGIGHGNTYKSSPMNHPHQNDAYSSPTCFDLPYEPQASTLVTIGYSPSIFPSVNAPPSNPNLPQIPNPSESSAPASSHNSSLFFPLHTSTGISGSQIEELTANVSTFPSSTNRFNHSYSNYNNEPSGKPHPLTTTTSLASLSTDHPTHRPPYHNPHTTHAGSKQGRNYSFSQVSTTGSSGSTPVVRSKTIDIPRCPTMFTSGSSSYNANPMVGAVIKTEQSTTPSSLISAEALGSISDVSPRQFRSSSALLLNSKTDAETAGRSSCLLEPKREPGRRSTEEDDQPTCSTSATTSTSSATAQNEQEKYHLLRERNNAAVRRARAKKRRMEEDRERQIKILKAENERLHRELSAAQSLLK